MQWEKSVPSNSLRIAGIPVDWSSDKQVWLYLEQIVVLILLSNTRKRFPSYRCFRAQLIYYITIVVCSYQYGAEKILSLSNILQMSVIQQWELFMHTYYVRTLIKWSWQSAAQLCLWSAVYQRWRWCKYTCEITAEKNNWIALIILHRNVKVNYSKSIYELLRRKQHCQLLNSKKAIFEIRHLTDILFR